MKKILFLDDDIFIIKAYKRKLRQINANIYYALTTDEAIEILNSNNIDILFSDLNLETCTCIEFIDKNINIIPNETYIITGADYNIKENSIIKGVLTKPIDYAKLITIIED